MNNLLALTPEQKNILATLTDARTLGLAADIAHATVTIYLQNEDKKYLDIYRQMHPQTQIGNVQPDLTGRSVRCVEEPLVMRALKQNIGVSGMREWALGSFNSFCVFPLQDGRGRCFGAISFDTADADEIIIREVLNFLRSLVGNKQPIQESSLYERLQPGDALIVVDPNKLVIAANNRAKHLFQIMDVKELVGKRTNDVAINWPLVGMVMATGIAESKEFTMHGLLLFMRVLPVVAKPEGGCAIVILQDVTELRKKDEELRIKSVVIKEIHHRVKNNLQTIASLLRLQARRAKSEETRTVLRDCMGRVNSIAIVHEYLSQQDTGLIDVAKVAKGIYKAIIESMLSPGFMLETEFKADAVQLPSEKATSIALILNELLQNAIEHAFEGRGSGRLKVNFHNAKTHYYLSITDDGVGLPENFDMLAGKSLGLKIIKTMAESDLHGKFTLANRERGGTLALVAIPKNLV